MKAIKTDMFVFILVLLTVFAGILIPLYSHVKQTPSDTFYPLAEGFFPDYYQYLSWIRAGADGNLWQINRYTYRSDPVAAVHVFFPLLGLVSKPFGLPPFQMLLLARLLATLAFFVCFFTLTKHLFTKQSGRILAILLLLSQTAIWQITWPGKTPVLVEPIPWVGTFNTLGKFNIPPHHLLSLALTLVVLALMVNPSTKSGPLAMAAAGVVLTFLNPSTTVIFLLSLAAAGLFQFLFHRSQAKAYALKLVPFLATSVPILAYHLWAFAHLMPWSLMYTLMRAFNPPTRFTDYLLALGPILPLALVSFTNRQFLRSLIAPVLLAWAFLPVLLFFLVGTRIPLNYSRLFQSYQYVPLAFLGVVGLQTLTKALARWRFNQKLGTMLVIILFVGYALFPFVETIKVQIQAISPLWYNVYLPVSAVRALQYLAAETSPDSVVLAGEFASQIIPAFSHNRTLIARADTTADYEAKLTQAYAFLDGKLLPAQASQFLKTYAISYVLFGFDAQVYAALPKDKFPGLTEVFRDGVVSVVKVN